jgi:SAM-dependent methyltransferase
MMKLPRGGWKSAGAHLIFNAVIVPDFVRRLEWAKMLQWLVVSGSDSILDVGCGRGDLAIRMSKTGALVNGSDVSFQALRDGSAMAERQHGKVQFTRSDGNNLPYRAYSFDKIVCSSSLEYFDDLTLLREMRRVLKPDGKVVLTADSNAYHLSRSLEKEFERKIGVFRFYSVASLTERFQEAGFTVLRAEYLFNSRASDFIYRLGIRLTWRGLLWTITSLLVYFPCAISDFILGDPERGHTVIIEAAREPGQVVRSKQP